MLGGLLALHATAPLVVVSNYPWDIFVALDGGWHVANGHWPHIDFHSPVGAFYYACYGLGLTLLGPDARVLLVVPALLGAASAALAWGFTVHRLTTPTRSLLCIWLGLLACSPAQFDSAAFVHLASYNRAGWALAIVAGLPFVLRPPRERDARWIPVAAGLVVATLLFLKVTLAAFALGLIAAGAMAWASARRPAAVAMATCGGAVVGVIALSAVVGRPLGVAYAADLVRTITAGMEPFGRAAVLGPQYQPGLPKLMGQITANILPICVTAALAVLGLRLSTDEAHRGRAAFVALACLAGSLVIAQQNHDLVVPPVTLAVVLAGVGLTRTLEGRWLTALQVGVGGMLLIPALQDGYGLLLHRIESSSTASGMATSGPGSRLVLPEHFGGLFMDGADAVRSEAAGKTTLVVGFSNPLPFLTSTPPPRGVLSWSDPGRTYGASWPDGAEYVDDVEVIALPPGWEADYHASQLWSVLGPHVEPHYRSVPARGWTLWVRD